MAQPPGWVPGEGPGAGLGASLLELLMRSWGLPRRASACAATEQLAGALSWRDAIALSQAMALPNELPAAKPPVQPWPFELARLRRGLQTGFEDSSSLRGAMPSDASLAEAAAPYRLHHASQQRVMAQRIASFREALRQALRAATPELARLAALDAVFEQALAEQERQKLALLPSMLVRRVALLRIHEPEPEPEKEAEWPIWRQRLWAELQQALQAELDLRLQPVLGLLEALHPELDAGVPSVAPAPTPLP